jgi:hypothetical protein
VDVTDGSFGFNGAANIGSQNSASYTIAVGISGAYITKKTEPTTIATITVANHLPGGYVGRCGSMSSEFLKGVGWF